MDPMQNQPNSNRQQSPQPEQSQPTAQPGVQQSEGQPYFDLLNHQKQEGSPYTNGMTDHRPVGPSDRVNPDPTAMQVPQKQKRFLENPVIAILKALGYFLIYLGVTFFLELAFCIIWVIPMVSQGLTYDQIQPQLLELINKNAMLLTIVADVLVLAIFAVIMVCRRKNPLSGKQNRELFNRVPVSRICYLIVMGIALNFALTLILSFVSPLLPDWMNQESQQTQDIYIGGGFLIYILGGVLLAPIVEEFVMRGLMASRFSRGMPKWLAVLIAALLFGCLHDAVIQKIYAGLLGVLLGMVFFRENSLFASVAVHFGFNLASLLPMIINQWGSDSYVFLSVLFMGLCMICLPIAIIMTVLYFAVLSPNKHPKVVQSPITGGTNPF